MRAGLRLAVCLLVSCPLALATACGDAPPSVVEDDAGVAQDAGVDAAIAHLDRRPPDAGTTEDARSEADRPHADLGPAADRRPRPDSGRPDAPPPVGSCSEQYIAPGAAGFRLFRNQMVSYSGEPNHRGRDEIFAPGDTQELNAKFAYNEILDVDLTADDDGGEQIEVWVRVRSDCASDDQGWRLLGTTENDKDGFVVYPIAPRDALPRGSYPVRMVLVADTSTADFGLYVWPRGTHVVVTDVDGTLTTSDTQLYQELIGNDPEVWPDADLVMQAYATANYRLFYLTGRPDQLTRLTRDFLLAWGFPVGPLRLTDQALDVVPSDTFVGAYKENALTTLQTSPGMLFDRAYGNATTDIYAYGAARIPKQHTYIIGDHGGEDGTVALDSYTTHLQEVRLLPPVTQP